MKRAETVLRRYFAQFESNEMNMKELIEMAMVKVENNNTNHGDEDALENIGFNVLEETIG